MDELMCYLFVSSLFTYMVRNPDGLINDVQFCVLLLYSQYEIPCLFMLHGAVGHHIAVVCNFPFYCFWLMINITVGYPLRILLLCSYFILTCFSCQVIQPFMQAMVDHVATTGGGKGDETGGAVVAVLLSLQTGTLYMRQKLSQSVYTLFYSSILSS